ncbi:MAG TPA: hypothetical protein VLH75_17495 [Longimicrobiales bacterium]|nr:hypothetical protein [Longimicrobiales bacterium]
MSDIDPKVLSAVEAALEKHPEATVDELFAVALEVSKDVAGLSKRQFHARYPLQVKRKLSPPRPRRPRQARPRVKRSRKPADGSVRAAVRATLLQFASDLAAAEARKDLVRVVASVDRYVDEVLKATGSA